MLKAQRIAGAVVVSRQEQPSIALSPLVPDRLEQRGRMALVLEAQVARPGLRAGASRTEAAVHRRREPTVGNMHPMTKTEREQAQKSIAENRKAFHDYHILETFEAGVALLGRK